MGIDNMSPHSGRYLADDNKVHNVVDRTTGAHRGITSDHANIHGKMGFAISGIFTAVANNATVNYAFKTPTAESGKIIHLKYQSFWASANKVRTDFYEAPTTDPINGTALVPKNRNRLAPIPESLMQVVKASMDLDLTGADNQETLMFGLGQLARVLDIEGVLAPDTWYIRTFTNSTGGAVDINFFDFWYEEEAV